MCSSLLEERGRDGCHGSSAPGRATERGKGTFLQLGQQDIASLKVPFPGCPCSPSATPLVPAWPRAPPCPAPSGTQAVPLAVSAVRAKLRLCRPLGLFSTCWLKALIPGEGAESPERLCQHRRLSVPPRAPAPGQEAAAGGIRSPTSVFKGVNSSQPRSQVPLSSSWLPARLMVCRTESGWPLSTWAILCTKSLEGEGSPMGARHSHLQEVWPPTPQPHGDAPPASARVAELAPSEGPAGESRAFPRVGDVCWPPGYRWSLLLVAFVLWSGWGTSTHPAGASVDTPAPCT